LWQTRTHRQTDRQTDRQTQNHVVYRAEHSSCGKNGIDFIYTFTEFTRIKTIGCNIYAVTITVVVHKLTRLYWSILRNSDSFSNYQIF